MSLTYVIPDLHGRSDLLDLALARIDAHAAGTGLTLVVLGDYVDKGPDSRGVIGRLRVGLPTPWRVAMLKGNHDALMVAALRGEIAMDDWLAKGGDAALASYGGDVAEVPIHDIAWLDGRPLSFEDAHRVYVHAGIEAALPLRKQAPMTLLTKRYADDDDSGLGGKYVVHGHDKRSDGPLVLVNRCNLDTNAWKSGQLVIGVFDDATPGGPIDVLEVSLPFAG
ncbi:MAG: serine/threonine protein phosphatase [Bradyrhizobiaceae bacterium PARB1]|nr:MAG: serine/threonine protein phosphatase [Bradyrhizobiaceae bacterium PARB1]